MHDLTLPAWDQTTQLLRRPAVATPSDITPVVTDDARESLEHQVLHRLEHPTLVPPDALDEAIVLAGRWRASRAAPALVALLAFDRHRDAATAALVAIGPYAVRPVLETLTATETTAASIDVAGALIRSTLDPDASDAWRYRADAAYFALCDALHRLLLDPELPASVGEQAAAALTNAHYKSAVPTIEALRSSGWLAQAHTEA